MTETEQKIVPQSMTIKQFEEGVHDGKIRGYRCRNCGLQRIDILEFCPNCHKAELEEVEFSDKGSVLTYTIQFVAPEQFMNEVPYAWAIIQLDDGPKITGWIPFISKPSNLPVGQRVVFKRSYLPGIVFEKLP